MDHSELLVQRPGPPRRQTALVLDQPGRVLGDHHPIRDRPLRPIRGLRRIHFGEDGAEIDNYGVFTLAVAGQNSFARGYGSSELVNESSGTALSGAAVLENAGQLGLEDSSPITGTRAAGALYNTGQISTNQSSGTVKVDPTMIDDGTVLSNSGASIRFEGANADSFAFDTAADSDASAEAATEDEEQQNESTASDC